MRARTRLRAYLGLWSLVVLLGTALVFAAAATGPVTRHIEDRALQETVAQAPTLTRDITIFEPTREQRTTAQAMHDNVASLLQPALADVVAGGWGAQRSRLEWGSGAAPSQHLSLVGDGVINDPVGYMPLPLLMTQTGLAEEAVRMVEGDRPHTSPAADEIEVMVSEPVADAVGLRVGEEYHLLLGVAGQFPIEPSAAPGPVATVRVTGIYEAVDPTEPGWELGALLAPGQREWPVGDQFAPIRQLMLVTDQQAVDNLLDQELDEFFGFQNVAIFRLDEQRLDGDWLVDGRDAVAALPTDPLLRETMRVRTGLTDLLDEFLQQAAAARAVAAVVGAGVVGTGVGLLILAARLSVERRRGEVALLRARGGSAARVVGRFLREALLVMVPAAVAGWGLHLLLPGSAGLWPPPGPGLVALAVAAVAVLAVPVAVAALPENRLAGKVVDTSRHDLARHRPAPARLTLELLVLVLAGLGVLLLHQRGLDSSGTTDPYLAAVPVLIGVAAGLLALRLYPWPLRLLSLFAARRRGAVGFLGLARAGRAAPATAMPLLVLVLAVAVGGFAAAVHSSVANAREAAAQLAVGADVRVTAEELAQAAAPAVAELPGVSQVAVLSSEGFARTGVGVDQNTAVLTVDAAPYQEVLAAIGAPQLPAELVAADPGAEPVPVMASQLPVGAELGLLIDRVEYRAVVVGNLADYPRLHGGRSWVLVPRLALSEPPAPSELLIAGTGIDPTAVAAATGADPAEVSVTTLAQQRDELEAAGFNRGLTLTFGVGTAGAAIGGLLAVGLSLVVPAAARGRTLSLLRTMGMSSRQGRTLLLVELLPITVLAVVIGAGVGITMPVMLAPALGLTEFTGGVPISLALDPTTVAWLAGLLVVFVVGGAVLEAAINRRLGLGRILRVE